MASQNLLELAKQGNVQAIDMLLNRMLEPKGVTAKAVLQSNRLHLLLESDHALEQPELVPFVHQAISRLGNHDITSLTIYGRQKGQHDQPWIQVVDLTPDDDDDLFQGITPEMAVSEQVDIMAMMPPAPPPQGVLGIAVPPQNLPDREALLVEEAFDHNPIPPLDSEWDRSENRQKGAPSPSSPDSTTTIEDSTEGKVITEPRETTTLPARETPIDLVAAVIGLTLVIAGIVFLQGRVMSEQARQTLEAADSLIAKQATFNDTTKVDALQANQTELATMINRLQSIPTIPFLVPEGSVAEDKAAILKRDQVRIDQFLNREKEATKTLRIAYAYAESAVNEVLKVNNDLNNPAILPTLKQAELKWQQAIAELQKVPKNTMAAKEADNKLPIYQSNYREVRKRIDSLTSTPSGSRS